MNALDEAHLIRLLAAEVAKLLFADSRVMQTLKKLLSLKAQPFAHSHLFGHF
jgi:hypothetical protein